MYSIPNLVKDYWNLGRRTKQTPSGWISGNAPCCHHRGQNPDTKSRGGLLLTPSGGFTYHCFNCGFKAGWTPGHQLSKNTKDLLTWIGVQDSELTNIIVLVLQMRDDTLSNNRKIITEIPQFKDTQLPENSLPIEQWLERDPTNPDIIAAIDYLINNRRFDLSWYPWHWSPLYRDRLIIPFLNEGRVVGWTGRRVVSGNPKYLTDAQPHYVFNIDRQRNSDKKYTIITEGQFDAIGIDGVAVMSNEIGRGQALILNTLPTEKIVVPDRDPSGAKLVRNAMELQWTVSLPPWYNTNVKDIADAIKHYGRIYTLRSILHYREYNQTKKELIATKLEHIKKHD